jgi:nitroimidazol reductase NimA-like FMN-containing flavoprotein (pyridoxamine 5'-phosphate oxidase superfamily)
MGEQEPVTELGQFSSPNASATDWERGRRELQDAELYWLSTVRPDGRPHVTPLIGVWRDGALYFCTGPDERKARNLEQNPRCVLTTGRNDLDGLDLVVEGRATTVSDEVERARVADTFESKYGSHFEAPDGTWAGLGDAIREGHVLLYRVAASKAFGFGKGGVYSQTRWRFS